MKPTTIVTILLAGTILGGCALVNNDGPTYCPELCAKVGCGITEGCNCGPCPEQDVLDEWRPADVWDAAETAPEEQGHDCAALCESYDRECGELTMWDCDCGTCGQHSTCYDGQCVLCADVCAGDRCLALGGCDCGPCAEGMYCTWEHYCQCQPQCEDPDSDAVYQCGDDGCEGSCGECKFGVCDGHFCACEPECEGKECGPDGCGGYCGGCPPGHYCDVDATCVQGCDFSDNEFTPATMRVVSLQPGVGGHPQEALDVDGQESTCAPAGNCQQGLDNQCSLLWDELSSRAEPHVFFSALVHNGDLHLLLEFRNYSGPDFQFTINVYAGLALAEPEICDWQTEECAFAAAAGSFDLFTCQPIFTLHNAMVSSSGALTAGGLEYGAALAVASEGGGGPVLLEMDNVTISGKVVFGANSLHLVDGLIGAAFPKASLLQFLALLPPTAGELLPVESLLMQQLVQDLPADVDLDWDGAADALSTGFKFSTLPATINGVL